MDANLVTAGAALSGSLVGASASFATTWFTQRYQSRREYFARQVNRREVLYTDFISEAARLYSDALVRNLEKPEGMATIWSLLSRIRLSASAQVIAIAEEVLRSITDQFASENLSLEEIRELALKSDPLKAFADACRAELDVIDRDR